MDLDPQRQLFFLKDEPIFSSGLKSDFSILRNAFLDFRELTRSLLCSFSLGVKVKTCFISKRKKRSLWLFKHWPPTASAWLYLLCRKGKVVELVISVNMCFLCAHSQSWISRACSALFTASAPECSGVGTAGISLVSSAPGM